MNESQNFAYVYRGRLLISFQSIFSDVYIEATTNSLPIEISDPILEDFEGPSVDLILIFLILNVNLIPKMFDRMTAKIMISVGKLDFLKITYFSRFFPKY
ncbi:hypothetical protein HZS_1153 [Henneguya salminicola]|nr:hypothetical protein HZS_1153 [Henneguya salminicola]